MIKSPNYGDAYANARTRHERNLSERVLSCIDSLAKHHETSKLIPYVIAGCFEIQVVNNIFIKSKSPVYIELLPTVNFLQHMSYSFIINTETGIVRYFETGEWGSKYNNTPRPEYLYYGFDNTRLACSLMSYSTAEQKTKYAEEMNFINAYFKKQKRKKFINDLLKFCILTNKD